MIAKLPTRTTVLTGRHVRLEPLTPAHVADLFRVVGGDDEVWRWTLSPTPHTEDELATTLKDRLADPACVPFAVVHLATGRAIGVTCYFDASTEQEQLEIGGTWYGRAHWRTAVNTESKLLLLTHAFEELGMGRVYWKIDHLNERSQAAVLRLGAVHEGTLRRHRRRPDGSWRDSVYFSMLREEWPTARKRLASRLDRG
ncbi:GNAT family N-acetyltransferase [Streptomyces huiliensis]|uniref:GNAT family N-acetyltransferase n=1 Tax=Streptomyces huiliensis TaxID=2876027 RepID=UPI001CBEED5D|nr:GNAT family protein [Streptomyces huiliensis]MBZ4320351.1 GNAT family N-acetyltransferase [Streptomyces huiliensis]